MCITNQENKTSYELFNQLHIAQWFPWKGGAFTRKEVMHHCLFLDVKINANIILAKEKMHMIFFNDEKNANIIQ